MLSKFKSFDGPSSFTWKDPDTGRAFNEASKANLMSRIMEYRAQNNLETIEHLSEVLENYWCGLPENRGKCVPVTLERGFLGFVKGGVTLIKKMVYKEFVDQGVADFRAQMCLRCPKMGWPDKGAFVKWSDDIAEASTLGRRSKFHDELGSCEICSCPLKAKVWLGGKIPLDKEWVKPMKAVGCWQISVGKVEENGN